MQLSQGETATFYVFAAGTAPLTYQWYRNGAAIGGATSATYSLATSAADNNAVFTVTVTNGAGSVTSAPATLFVTAKPAGLGGFSLPRPGYYGSHADLTAVRFRFNVVVNQDPNGKIIFGFNYLYSPASSVTGYDLESNVYSWRNSFASGGCTTYPPLGTSTYGEASLRNATADYPYQAGQQPSVGSAMNTSDPLNWPVQTYLVDNIAKLYKSDSISQFSINGLDALVTVQRGGTVTDVSAFARCGIPMLPGLYRMWTVTTEIAGRDPVVNTFVAPDAAARYIVPAQALQFASEFLSQPGVFAVQYWDFAYMTESNPVWTSATSFMTSALYDGAGNDFGVHVVSVNGQDRVEFSNVPGNAYLSGNLPFSMAPPPTAASSSCSYVALSPVSVQSPPSGGTFSIAIQSDSACARTVSGLPGWITGASSGPGTITLALAPNTSNSTLTATVSVAGVSVTVTEFAAASAVQVVTGDFGTGNSFSTTNTWCITGAQTPYCGPAVTRYLAAPFVPATMMAVSGVSLPLSYNSGTNGAVVSLASDSGGIPGAVLESWSVSNLPTSPAVISESSKLTPVLQPGQTYWLVVQPLAADTLIAWYTNNRGLSGGLTNIGQTGWASLSGYGGQTLPAFSVAGSAWQAINPGGVVPLFSSVNTIQPGSWISILRIQSGACLRHVERKLSECGFSGGSERYD